MMITPATLNGKFQMREDAYLFREEIHIRKELTRSMSQERARRAIQDAVGLDDIDLADRLIDAGFTADSLPAIAAIPFAIMAWASGEVSDEERGAALIACYNSEFCETHVSHDVFRSWLTTRPRRELFALWEDYFKWVYRNASTLQLEAVQDRLVASLTQIAFASGGVLGIGKMCANERNVLQKVKATIDSLRST